MTLQLKFESEGNPDITWYFGAANASFQDGVDNYPEQGVEASYATAFANANADKGATLWACRSANLISVWGGYGDTDAEKVHNAQNGIARIADCVSNSFTMDGAHFTYIEDLGQLQNETYVYTKNGKKIKWTGSLMQVYDENDNLLGSSSYVTAGAYPYFVNIPSTIPKEWTITDWRNNVNVGYLNPTFVRTGGGVEAYSNFLTTARVSKVTGSSDIQNHADWLYYLLHDPNEDFSPDEKPEPGPEPGDDPYSPYLPPEPGGDGDGDDPTDPGENLDYPDDPDLELTDSGLIALYTPSDVQLHLLGEYIWSQDFVNSLVRSVYADPMDVILSLGVVPFNVVAAGVKNIKVGDRDASVGSTVVTSNYPQSSYQNIDCGSIPINSGVGCYLDYSPFTKGHVYIPFVGYVPLDVDYYMGHSLGLKYKVELVTGTAVAYLLRDNCVMQQFSCNLKIQIPLTSANAMQMWRSLIETTISAGALAAGGAGIAAGAGMPTFDIPLGEANKDLTLASGAPLRQDAANIINGLATKPSFQKSNPHGVSAGFLGSKFKPALIMERPHIAHPDDQNIYTGYGAFNKHRLSSLSGFTRVASDRLSVPSATGKELSAIRNILHEGFIINGVHEKPEGDLVLFRNSSPNNVIGKSTTVVDTLTGTFRHEANVMDLTIRIEKNSPVGFNYLYSKKFDRFYYVDEITVVRTGILDLHCTVDVLDSFSSEILNNDVLIDKQQNAYNLYLNDDSLKICQNPYIQTHFFPHGLGEAYEYVLVVAGSN